MATLLYRLGRFAYRRAWLVIGVWILLVAAVFGAAVLLGGKTQDSFAIPGTESQQALDRLDAVFPSVAGASAEVVAVAPKGTVITDASSKAAIDAIATKIKGISGIDSVTTPFDSYAGKAISDDKTTAITKVQFTGASTDVKPTTLTALKDTASIGKDAGLTINYGGQVFQDTSFGITITEALGVIFAGIVLLITFGSLLAAGMPLLSALLGVGIVIGGITTVSAFTTVSSSAPLLALMIGLAVGIDYSLFILSRHRTQLARGEEPIESTAMAVGTAGSAVVFAGLTVIIALLGLLVVNIPFLSVMGIGAAFAVLIAIGVATTLLPALLGLAKHRMTPKPGSRASRRALADPETRPALGLRWVKLIMKAPIVAVVLVVGILGALAIPALSLDLNLPDGGSEPVGSTQRIAYDTVTEKFGAGFNGPLVVSVDITQTTAIESHLKAIAAKLDALPDVAAVSQGFPDAGLDTAIIQVTPSSAPDALATKNLVQSIRDLEPSIKTDYHTPITVTGTTAVGIDISNRLTNALIPFGIVVVGLSVLLLMMVFRSILVPIKAALGFLLSVVGSFGVVVAVFQWGWFGDLLGVDKTGPILSFMPIILMAVLFGLAMDYEVFLVSGMREEFVKTGDARRSVAHGFASGARVVTAAASIMFFVFFAFVPGGASTIKAIALGLTVGILFDAFLVRMTLVPAIMTLLGRSAWWIPRWLARTVPNVDIEGEALRDHRDSVLWASKQSGASISADNLVVGTDELRIGPISASVAPGALVLAHGEVLERRLLAATLAGRVPLVSGRAQIAGLPLPSETGRVSRLVALADVGGSDRAEGSLSIGALLRERIVLTQPWYRLSRTGRRTRLAIERINAVLRAAAGPGSQMLTLRSAIDGMPQLERAVALAAVALAERPTVLMLDLLDGFADAADELAFLAAVHALAPASTTVIIGTKTPADAVEASIGRPVVDLDVPAAHSSAEAAKGFAL